VSAIAAGPSGSEVPAHPSTDPLAAADPEGALRAALVTGDGAAPGAAPARSEEILLSWLLGLAEGLDPAAAAACIVAAVDAAAIRNDRLLGLLAEVARWPAPRLARLKRRHGRSPRRTLAT
jgi:hypothetical protein